jgi:hypothetical protein
MPTSIFHPAICHFDRTLAQVRGQTTINALWRRESLLVLLPGGEMRATGGMRSNSAEMRSRIDVLEREMRALDHIIGL